MKISKYIAAGLIGIMGLTSCGDDFMDVEYTEQLDQTTAGEAAAKDPSVFLNGMWSWMVSTVSSHDDFGVMSIMHSTDMMSEDIAMAAFSWFGYDYDFDNRMYNYRRTSSNWKILYTMISKANEIISLYPEATNDDVKALLGQALAIRGYSYYYLVQLFQNPTGADGKIDRSLPAVPIMLTEADGYTAEELDALKGRNTVGDVFDQMDNDLNKAAQYLEEAKYSRPNKNYIDANVAYGILARYNLLAGNWQAAADAAKKAHTGYKINSSYFLSQLPKGEGFTTVDDPEWMWGFNHDTETQTTYASFFSQISSIAPGYCGIGYNQNLIDARLYSQIPANDVRKQWFNGPNGNAAGLTAAAKNPYAPQKFGHISDWSEDYMYMRAPEMILIEAEAYVRMGQGAKGAQVLAELMNDRQPGWSEQHAELTLDEVLLQRRIELWGEGFAFFDLKRNNLGVDRNYEGSNHLAGYLHQIPARDIRWVYQIPSNELQENKHISDSEQNP